MGAYLFSPLHIGGLQRYVQVIRVNKSLYRPNYDSSALKCLMNWFRRTKTPRTAGLVVERNGEFKLKNFQLAEISFVEVDTTESLPFATTPSPPPPPHSALSLNPAKAHSRPHKRPQKRSGFSMYSIGPV